MSSAGDRLPGNEPAGAILDERYRSEAVVLQFVQPIPVIEGLSADREAHWGDLIKTASAILTPKPRLVG